MHRQRIVAVHVENRHLDHLRDVGAYIDERASSGSVVKPIWLFTTTCTVPPVP